MSKVRRLLVSFVAVVVSVGLVGEPAHADPVSAEEALVTMINGLRASDGLHPLTLDGRLSDVARAWSTQMAVSGAISHNANLPAEAPREWVRLGENVGVGTSVESLHEAFVASPTHYPHLVDPGFRQIGVGVVEVGGELWVTQQFMSAGEAPRAIAKPKCPKRKRCGVRGQRVRRRRHR